MSFPISAGLLDSMVLAIVEREDTYGYEITQTMRKAVDVSESTLYPVLKRLQKSQMLETYDKEFMGRNRRYYHVTAKGRAQLSDYKSEWLEHKQKVDSILLKETEKRVSEENNKEKEEVLPQEA
ncbi:PadR family transcriptional regulator [Ruminococcus sp. FC2018]|uniref:PadR family transcriptional regulator n=1 Tax=Ruminococcus sp. FC2018 TaxID=1410617 RepID=UPI00055D28FC|nr:PadR family transcriptional regulator [Ruminococcus sp. FC2018]